MFAQTNLKHIRSSIATSIVPGSTVTFTAYTGAGSFADGIPYKENICETCHSLTNHHQSDGTTPGGQTHKDGADCRTCHTHGAGFADHLVNTPVPAPHNATACTACHTAPDSYVFGAAIPNAACQSCHGQAAPGTAGGGSDKKAERHFSDKYIDPTTGMMSDIKC
ncbi:MAG: hypothetical protein Q7T18_10670, partial [Sedimentisphaerales bacterium]|nr:hypothetical protein [Sedimentisphaerales bacterium]